MPLTLSERTEIAHQVGPFQRRVMGALVKHAKWVIRTETQPDSAKALARLVLNDPGMFVSRFGLALLTEPMYDGIESDSDVGDTNVTDTVGELWLLFAPTIQPEGEGA